MCRSCPPAKKGEAIAPSPKPINQNKWVSPYNPQDPSVSIPSIAEIKAVIPKHCFERSYFWSTYYVFRDTAWAIACAYIATKCLSTNVPSEPMDILKWVAGWSAYIFSQGTILFGHWILGHECGHGAFSPSTMFNDVWGFILHQAVLVPYFAWKYSHAKHHRRVNHLVDGESHVPSVKTMVGLTESDEREGFYAILHETLGENLFTGVKLTFYLLLGYPLYLAGYSSTGILAHDGTPLNDSYPDHFRPNSPLFPAKVYWKIAASTIAQFGLIGSLLYVGQFHTGHLPVFLYYWAPYLVVNAWLVVYTWLHHTDSSVPHYGADEWTWVRGALGTIDRPYGIFDFFHHRIGSTHVVHHLFHELPWYHAYEATAAVKAYLEPKGLYNYDPRPFPVAMWQSFKECHYVESREGIQYYKSLNDLSSKKTK
jgi:omega-6 fatty acid desaturase / acyl-lipid omega-6 desaturase (Delta-12 desaturase)